MKDKLEQIKAAALDSIAAAADLDQINEIRVRYLGKKGELTTILRGMGALSAEERPLAGQPPMRCARVLKQNWAGKLKPSRKRKNWGVCRMRLLM